jgi:hypothetical protein
MTTTEEPINQTSQQARQPESVKHQPELLSNSYRNRVLKVSSSYRNPLVKHEPELHRASALSGVYPLCTTGEVVEFRRDAK